MSYDLPPDSSGEAKAEVDHKRNFLVVGIGASAGGIKALNELFVKMPDEPGMAFVVILHLSQQHKSNLAEILQRSTRMPVEQVTETVRVEPNKVFVIPPAKHLEMVDGVMRLTEPERIKGKRVTIDRFLRSLADAYGRRAVSIILSGTGTDGTLGVKHVKGHNGFAIVQDPSDAEYDGMPVSAIETKVVDVVLPAAAMADKLLSVRDSTERLRLTDRKEEATAKEIKNLDALREILALLRVRTNHDFSNYKRPTVIRRVARHLQIHEIDDLREYLRILREKPKEVHSLLKNLLINVTSFFRDTAAFDALETQVIPALFKGKTAVDTVRVWVAGCASGEEAYSMAILLHEQAQRLTEPPKIQVFASDVDEEAIAEAREGCYTESIAADVSAERLKQFFTKDHDTYRIRKPIRETILFAPHNILRDPPFSRVDLVSCRNLLIYLNRETQDRVLQIFHFAVKEGGYLFLGSSESADSIPKNFTAVDKKHRIYRFRPSGSEWNPPPLLPLRDTWGARIPELPTQTRPQLQSFLDLHHRLIEEYAPPSILVSDEGDILHLSEHAGRFLRFVGGNVTANLLKVVHPALLAELRALLFAAKKDNTPVEARNLRARIDGEDRSVTITVRPVKMADAAALVIFEDTAAEAGTAPAVEAVAAGDKAMEGMVGRLEEELGRTKDHLRHIIEDYETAVEEHKAANEEMQAMNEELRSTAEELETGKEELQSVNEELTTVNNELKEKVEEVSRVNADLQNLMASTEIATIFLDRDTKITRYTPKATQLFNLIPGDIGRPLEHVTHRFAPDGFAADAARTLQTLHSIEREVAAEDGRTFIARFSPYRTVDEKIDGLVLTFVDITDRKRAEDALAADLAATAVLRDVAARLVTEENVHKTHEHILSAAIEITGADAGTLQVYEPETQELVLLVTRGFERNRSDHFHRVAADATTPSGIALKTGARTFVDFDAEGADEACRMHIAAGYRSGQCTPLLSRSGVPIGMLNTHWRASRHRPSDRQLRFLDLLARQAADLIEHRHAQAALRESETSLSLALEDARRLQKISNLNFTEKGLKEQDEQILDMAIETTRADFGSLQVLTPGTDQLVLAACRNFHPALAEVWPTVDAGSTACCGLALASGERILVSDVETSEVTAGTTDLEHYRRCGIRAVQTTPLIARGGRLVGMLSTHWREPHEPSERDLQRLDLLARQAADLIAPRQAEANLRVSEEQFHRAVEDAPIPIIMHAEDGQVLQISKAWTELTGYGPKDIPDFNAWLNQAYGEGADDVRRHMQVLFRGQRRSLNVEFPVRTRMGGVRYWSFSASAPGTLHDGRRFIVGMAVDITERRDAEETLRQSEERLRLMVESVSDYAILTMDEGGCITSWHAGAEATFGYTADEVLGQPAAILFTPEDRQAGEPEREMRNAREHGRAADERWHLRKDGSRFFVSGVLARLRAGERVTGYVKIARDLTHQRQAAEALQQAHSELEQRVRERTSELAGVNASLREEIAERVHVEKERTRLLQRLITAQEEERRRIARELHDTVGQQLTALRMSLEMVEFESQENTRLPELLARAQSIRSRLESEVDFLAWELRPVALDQLGLDAALQAFVQEWSEHFNIQADYQGVDGGALRLGREVETNLYRIVQEALQNVHKHAAATQVSVTLVRRDGTATLVIEDNGRGYDPDAAKAAGTSKGMGVTNMRERARLLGGEVEFQTAPGAGTTIYVRVPTNSSWSDSEP